MSVLGRLVAAARPDDFTSLGLSTRAHIMVMIVCLIGAIFLLRLLRRRQLRGKYTLLWILTGGFILTVGTFPSLLDRTAKWLSIYYATNLLFVLALAFLLLVTIYFSYELSRLEERTRILAEELAILRGDLAAKDRSVADVGQAAGEPDGA